jgi:hypothetical protein
MSKYAPLTDHLAARKQQTVAMSFPELEAVLGFPLPRSARKFREWWSNNPRNHTQATAWLKAGYKTRDVDFEKGRLLFEKLNATEPETAKPGRHPLIGCMAGMITVAPGVDLTDPIFTDEELDAFLERKIALIEGRLE